MTDPIPTPGPGAALFVALQRLLPQHGLSRVLGRAANAHALRKPLIEVFRRAYQVDLSEAARTSPAAYESFNDFFTRELKPGARPLAEDAATAVCPADGCVSQAGPITGGRLLQAKGHTYSLAALLAAGETAAQRFEGGTFATIYLAPRDYHRVHLPMAGRLVHTTAVPGALYSVNAATEAHVQSLFARNERLVCEFETEAGRLLVVLIGAMIVASIQTVWPGPASPYRTLEDRLHDGPRFPRGAEIGRFLLGSTVIVCTEPGRARLVEQIRPGATVRMGQALFHL